MAQKTGDWADLTYVVVDVEGNGQQPPDLVELATVPIVNGAIAEPQSWLVHPHRPINPFATRIHGLTDSHVVTAPKFASLKPAVLAALDREAIVAHNAHIDLAVLRRELDGWLPPEVFDTLKLARRLLPGRASYRLGALTEAFELDHGLPDALTPHRATYDALVTARLFLLLAEEAGTLQALRGHPPEGHNDLAAIF